MTILYNNCKNNIEKWAHILIITYFQRFSFYISTDENETIDFCKESLGNILNATWDVTYEFISLPYIGYILLKYPYKKIHVSMIERKDREQLMFAFLSYLDVPYLFNVDDFHCGVGLYSIPDNSLTWCQYQKIDEPLFQIKPK